MAGSEFLDNVKGVTAEFEKQAALRAQIESYDSAGGKALASAQGLTSELSKQSALKQQIASFNAKEFADTAKLRAEFKAMQDEALGVKRNIEGASESLGSILSKSAAIAGAIGAVKSAASAAFEEFKRMRDMVWDVEQELGLAGAKLAIFKSSQKEVESAAFKKLGGNYDRAVKVAVKLGLNEDEAVAEVKKMLNAGFSQGDTEVMMKIKAGMGAEGKDPAAYFAEMEKLKLEPKVKKGDLDKLYKLGIDSKKVYADLDKQLGGNGKALQNLKAGTLDSGMVIKAINKQAIAQYGDMANIVGNTVPAMLARAKSALEHLFDGVSMTPIKEALKNVVGELEGGAGAELKMAVADLFGSAFGTALSDFQGKSGKAEIHAFFHSIAEAVHQVAAQVRALRPEVEALIATFKRMSKDGTFQDMAKAGKMVAGEKIAEMGDKARAEKARAAIANGDYSDVGGASETVQKIRRKAAIAAGVANEENYDRRYAEAVRRKKAGEDRASVQEVGEDEDKAAASGKPKAATAAAAKDSGAAASDVLNAGAPDAGAALPQGMAEGIEANASTAITAAEKMAEDALQAAKDKLGVASPSKEFGEVGGFSAEGYADALATHPGPAKAAAQMGANALGGAGAGSGLAAMAGAGAGAAAGGGGGSSGAITFAPVISGGNASENKKMLEAMFPEFLAQVRRAARDGMSGARP